jgi:hypothetical protein
MRVRLHGWISQGAKSAPLRLVRVTNVTRGTNLASSVEVADTTGTRRRGLLGRMSLPAGHGLWIIPCEGVHTWFMHFPIDLIFVNRDRRIVRLRSDVVPWRLSACFSAVSVLEVAAGSIRASGTERGDLLDFSSAVLVGDDIDCPTEN